MGAAKSSIRVMVVDDDQDTANALSKLLALRGYMTAAVTDSCQCLSQFDKFQPHVVLLDIKMPRMSGYDLTREIRTRADSAVKIIAVSGFSDDQHRQAAMAAGFDQYLLKPVDVAAIEAAIQQSL